MNEFFIITNTRYQVYNGREIITQKPIWVNPNEAHKWMVFPSFKAAEEAQLQLNTICQDTFIESFEL